MKQLCVIIILGLLGWVSVNAQSDRYSVFDVVGRVQVKQGQEWKEATKYMPLRAFDELKILDKSSIRIIDAKTNAIYKTYNEGEFTVRQLIKTARLKSESTLSSLTEGFTKRMSSQVGGAGLLKSIGAAHRGFNDKSIEDYVCSTILFLANRIITSDTLNQTNKIICHRMFEDDIYTLSLENKSDSAYCVNIVSLDLKTNKCRLVLSPRYEKPYIILDAHTHVDLKELLFCYNPDEFMFMIILDEVFDNEVVKSSLEDYNISDGMEQVHMQYSIVK